MPGYHSTSTSDDNELMTSSSSEWHESSSTTSPQSGDSSYGELEEHDEKMSRRVTDLELSKKRVGEIVEKYYGGVNREQEEGVVTNDVKGVSFCKGSQSWRAQWYSNGQKLQKRFGVEKFGFEGAKMKAVEYRKEMERTGQANLQHRIEDPRLQSKVNGVQFRTRGESWRCEINQKGKRRWLCFSVNLYGFERAKALAEMGRRVAEKTGRFPTRDEVLAQSNFS